MNSKWIIMGVVILLLVAFLIWLFVASSKPLPGQKIDDLGRKHVPVGTKVDYNSNPPTSGDHYADWVRSGVYDIPRDDGYLIHSLEHGYVIMSYNCARKETSNKRQVTSIVYAHGTEEEASSGAEATSSSELSAAFKSEDCHKLVDQLISIYEKKGKTRLIVTPRPELDARIALTAWNYIDKFDAFDGDRIEKFIDTHLNQGPEKTMETPGK
ncbi:DUF3105 domain-containing protein [Candidatus Microgenomates bacterium]|nr:DUF3105 domain-containing protein [Candidatus Microgenomates bacterium]